MELVDYMNIGMGLLLIVIGWLCYRFPNMINPYGDMPPERKALVDIDGLKKSVAITMAVTGILLIVTVLLFICNVISEIVSVKVVMVLVIAMLVPLFIAMKKYNGFGRDENGEGYYSLYMNKAAKITVVIVTVMVAAVVVFLAIVL
jgi:hypothetical protein